MINVVVWVHVNTDRNLIVNICGMHKGTLISHETMIVYQKTLNKKKKIQTVHIHILCQCSISIYITTHFQQVNLPQHSLKNCDPKFFLHRHLLFTYKLKKSCLNEDHKFEKDWFRNSSALGDTLKWNEPGLLVAPMINTCFLVSKPSISVKSWLTTRAVEPDYQENKAIILSYYR